MALYSRPDYYVKTFTARNCSFASLAIETAAPLNLIESGPRPFQCERKQNVCLSRPRPCWSKSLISVWAQWPSGGSALRYALPFSAFRVQPTPSGGFEKVRFAIPSYTGRRRCWMHRPRLECPSGAQPARSGAPKQCAARPMRASAVPAPEMPDSHHRQGGPGVPRTCMAATCGAGDPNNTCGPGGGAARNDPCMT